ncbi:hypothetical protein J2N86_11645 [Legionella lytica]|uniref:Dot/Icm T4SS effector n=1 Tax=Legionella lytica TaxID=96232 RepID=A0ABY4Y6U8_9GAMM|nr:hypothetical protein [Legionella lytica]USQ13332.1 hypothetical protein J2N86_11645 [Legionella lytica]
MNFKTEFSFFQKDSQQLTMDDFDLYFRKLVLDSYEKRFDSVADAKFHLALQGCDLQTMVNVLLLFEKLGVLEKSIEQSLFYPVGCGDIANAFCNILTKSTLFTPLTEKPPQISSLAKKLGKDLPKIIRIDIPGHSYVMLACEKIEKEVFGYIYQSNIAEGMEDNSFSLSAWLMDARSQKTNLTKHLNKVMQLLDVGTDNEEKISIYEELFIATPIVTVKNQADLNAIIKHINEHPNSSRYKAQHVTPKKVISTLQRFEQEYSGTHTEHKQLLGDFIEQSRVLMKAREQEVQDPTAELDSPKL